MPWHPCLFVRWGEPSICFHFIFNLYISVAICNNTRGLGGAARRGAWGEGRPPRGPAAPPWATAAAVGPRGGGLHWGGDLPGYYTKPQDTIQSPKTFYKALTDYTKPDRLYKDIERLYGNIQYWTKPYILDKHLKIFNKSDNKY